MMYRTQPRQKQTGARFNARRWARAFRPLIRRGSALELQCLDWLRQKHIFDGPAGARLIASTASPPPKGRKRRTVTTLKAEVVQLNIVNPALRPGVLLCAGAWIRVLIVSA